MRPELGRTQYCRRGGRDGVVSTRCYCCPSKQVRASRPPCPPSRPAKPAPPSNPATASPRARGWMVGRRAVREGWPGGPSGGGRLPARPSVSHPALPSPVQPSEPSRTWSTGRRRVHGWAVPSAGEATKSTGRRPRASERKAEGRESELKGGAGTHLLGRRRLDLERDRLRVGVSDDERALDEVRQRAWGGASEQQRREREGEESAGGSRARWTADGRSMRGAHGGRRACSRATGRPTWAAAERRA